MTVGPARAALGRVLQRRYGHHLVRDKQRRPLRAQRNFGVQVAPQRLGAARQGILPNGGAYDYTVALPRSAPGGRIQSDPAGAGLGVAFLSFLGTLAWNGVAASICLPAVSKCVNCLGGERGRYILRCQTASPVAFLGSGVK